MLRGTQKISFLIVVEQEILLSTENFSSALLYMFGAYYCFNIKYSKLSYPVMIFF